jgi:hypothetical protein
MRLVGSFLRDSQLLGDIQGTQFFVFLSVMSSYVTQIALSFLIVILSLFTPNPKLLKLEDSSEKCLVHISFSIDTEGKCGYV